MAADEPTPKTFIPKPVTLLPDPTSLLVRNLQPLLLLSLISAFFGRLVRDPTNTLLALAPTLAIVQAAYCVCCLPSTAQNDVPSGSGKSGPVKKKKPAKSTGEIGGRVVPTLLSLILSITLSTPLLYLLIILFGAPPHLPTLLLALHLALLTTPPLFYVHGLDQGIWRRLVSLQQPVDEVYGMAAGALLGAWVGAIPIPLDWDREWQRWPVTVVCGMYVGAVGGKVVGGYLLNGARGKIC